MSMKYVGYLTEDDNRYCYGWSFLKVRKQWLKDPKRETSITTEIKCELADTGEDCAGNIINNSESGICEEVDVKFTYDYCLRNNNKNMDAGINIVNSKSFMKLKGKRSRLKDASNTEKAATCRQEKKSYSINTCDEKTSTMMRIKAGLIGSMKRSTNVIRLAVHSAVKCTPDFVITEVYRNPGMSFVELYTPTCQGQIITDNIWLVKFINDKIDMVNPRSLKGELIPNDGFFVVCETASLDGKCDIITGGGLADDAGSAGTIALITNLSLVNELVNESEGEGENSIEINDVVVFQNEDVHVIRNEDSEAQSTFDQSQWTSKSCDSPESDTPCSITEGRWGDITSAPADSGDNSADSGDGRKGGSGSVGSKAPKGSKSPKGSTAPTSSSTPKEKGVSKFPKGSKATNDSSTPKEKGVSKFPKGSKAPNDSSTPEGKGKGKGKGKGSISPSTRY